MQLNIVAELCSLTVANSSLYFSQETIWAKAWAQAAQKEEAVPTPTAPAETWGTLF